MSSKNSSLATSGIWTAVIDLEGLVGMEEFDWYQDQMKSNIHIPIALNVIYMSSIYFGTKFMSTRPSFDLRRWLFLWSAILALYSIVGTVRTWMVVAKIYNENGMYGIVCDERIYTDDIARFWTFSFVISKFFEFVDTAFIVLRKKPLIFLHWYHHATVSMYTWLSFGGRWTGGSVFMPVNFAIHASMYTYYAVRASGRKLPKFISVFITSSQIIQMVAGCATMVAVLRLGNDTDCITSTQHKVVGSIMYASYLVLFCNFFYQTYLSKSKSKVSSRKKTS